MNTKTLELNKRYPWKEIVEVYPDMWAFLIKPEFSSSGDLISGILIAICKYESRETTAASLFTKGIDYTMMRTTSNDRLMGGILCSYLT